MGVAGFLGNVGLIVGIISALISIIVFVWSKKKSIPLVFAIVAGILIVSWVLGLLLTPGQSNAPPVTGANSSPQVHHSPTATPTFILTPTFTPTLTPTPSPANATDWGTLTGDSLTVNKTLTCGDGCPDPVLVEITTIQINKPSEMTWNLSLTAPPSTQNSGFTEASFPQFILYSDTTPPNQANIGGITQSIFQAKFPFAPVSNQTYTLIVTVSYHTITNGIVSIEAQSTQFLPVTMLFQP